jgi:predicted MFS family arabinose efflux permease
MNRAWLSLGAAIALVIYGPVTARACSVCLTGDSGPIADAYNWSILFLMAAPYTVMGCVGAWLVYQYRRTTAKQRRAEREQPLTQLALDYKESAR